MKKTNSKRTCKVSLYFTVEEYSKIEHQWIGSTCQTRNNYLRNQIFEKPITINCRDQSIDEYMSEIIQLRGELNALCNNFNKIEIKLDSLRQIPEYIVWLISIKLEKEKLLVKVEEIKNHIKKMAEKWLQS